MVLFLAFASVLSAQENNKGNISLIFNEYKIDLPVTSIILRKENLIRLSIRGEQSIDDDQKIIALEFSLKDLKTDTKEFVLEGTRINILIRRNGIDSHGEELLVWFPENDFSEGKAHYSVYKKGQKLNWDISSFNMKFNIDNISYFNGSLKINGSFSGKFRSDLTKDPFESTAEIKDGKFEIVI